VTRPAGAHADEPPAVDVHVHLAPIDPARLERLSGVRLRDGRLEVDGEVVAVDDLYRPDRLLAWLDDHDLDIALISAPPPLYRPQLEEAEARHWVDYLNDGLAAIAARHPDRLRVLAHLPPEHPRLALAQAHARRGGCYTGFSMAAGGEHARVCSDPDLRPLWQALDEAGSFVFLHPGACADGRLRAFYAANLLGNPYETTVAAAHLVFGGVIEEHPRIAFCLAHCGGAVAALAGRWQRGFDTARPGVDTGRAPPAEILKRFYVDCIAHDPGLIALAGQVFGADRIVFGSDWPFPMGLPEPDAALAALDPDIRERIRRINIASAGVVAKS
jgi:aminocarboxymuconate-semialdehyde decarboxylase